MKSLILFTVTTAVFLTFGGCSNKTATGNDLDAFADTANVDTLTADTDDVAVSRDGAVSDVPVSDVDAFAHADMQADTGEDTTASVDTDIFEDTDVMEDVPTPTDVNIRPDGGPDGDVPPGPVNCTVEQDCGQPGACPSDASKGCTCATTPDGKLCIPLCSTDNDCPKPPGQTLTCTVEGICVPARP